MGREVRLVLAPHPLAKGSKVPSDGMWITFHLRQDSSRLGEQQLAEMLAARLKSTMRGHSPELGDMQSSSEPSLEVRRPFSYSIGQAATSQRGVHLLIRIDAGIVEMQAAWPSGNEAVRMREFESVRRSLTFHHRRTENEQVAPQALDARDALGSWKAYRSRLRLDGDGRVTIRPDGVHQASFEDQPVAGARNGLLTGRFQADGDLLFVIWDDGSRLNFRWRRQGDNLLLTDHDGQMSQLRRILE